MLMSAFILLIVLSKLPKQTNKIKRISFDGKNKRLTLPLVINLPFR